MKKYDNLTETHKSPYLTVLCPLYNEEDNLSDLVDSIKVGLGKLDKSYELLLVNDGSTDNTLDVAKGLALSESNIRIVSYSTNKGRGKALRTGFENARGDIVVSIDADLTYDVSHILRIVEIFENEEATDVVIGSPYMRGGQTIDVPFFRLLISKIGNIILRFAINHGLRTFTGILRGYRKYVLDSLDLNSDGKEIHLEILSKIIALGYNIREMPSTLRGRKTGHSKFKFRLTAFSHLVFTFFERPILLFGIAGLIFLLIGLCGGGYIIFLWASGNLNPERPLMNLTVLLILTGIQILFFGFLATQLVILRSEIYRIQKENQFILKNLKKPNQ
ncbi:glycosyltransferase family 2 protein [bacterium]|nr:glycosyltransferase family 2 protein [bacterium]